MDLPRTSRGLYPSLSPSFVILWQEVVLVLDFVPIPSVVASIPLPPTASAFVVLRHRRLLALLVLDFIPTPKATVGDGLSATRAIKVRATKDSPVLWQAIFSSNLISDPFEWPRSSQGPGHGRLLPICCSACFARYLRVSYFGDRPT